MNILGANSNHKIDAWQVLSPQRRQSGIYCFCFVKLKDSSVGLKDAFSACRFDGQSPAAAVRYMTLLLVALQHRS